MMYKDAYTVQGDIVINRNWPDQSPWVWGRPPATRWPPSRCLLGVAWLRWWRMWLLTDAWLSSKPVEGDMGSYYVHILIYQTHLFFFSENW